MGGAPESGLADQGEQPGHVSSVDQYVEDIPGASGSTPTGGIPGVTPGTTAALAPDAENAIHDSGGTDAEALMLIATRPALGAPVGRLAAAPGLRDSAEEQSIGAAVASSTTPALFALVVLLAGVTVTLVGLAARRIRR